MDYLEMAALRRHLNWQEFQAWRISQAQRLVLLTTKAATPYTAHDFQPGDILLFGRESAGVPNAVHEAADARLTIPMAEGARSINLALSVAMVAGEAMRQLA
jgi:tRNA (cytidine/uridine-2'-O-)-methyltransferase